MSNLDRAKELRDRNYAGSKKSNRCSCKDCKLYYHDLQNQARQLKEEVEKGCGEKIHAKETGYKLKVLDEICGEKGWLCNECQETLKILNKILGEGE